MKLPLIMVDIIGMLCICYVRLKLIPALRSFEMSAVKVVQSLIHLRIIAWSEVRWVVLQ